MFRPQRSLSTRRLWRRRCSPLIRGQGEGPAPEEPHNGLRPAALQIFKKLRDEQLWRLAEAVESRGRWDCGCIWYPQEVRPLLPPQVLLCKLYRWPDLRSPAELKRLSQCQEPWRGGAENSATCCNPYHYSRLLPPDPAAPMPYKERVSPRPLIPRTHPLLSSARGVQDTTQSRGWQQEGHWCKLAYWEHRTRVGRLFGVSDPSVHIFQDLPQGSGFCLGFLGGGGARSRAVRRTRQKIGQGLTLSREQGGEVWVYNRSEHPLFINSPTLPCGAPVCRLPPGYSAKVYDARLAQSLSRSPASSQGPSDPHSLRISFAKGWGACYSRQAITSCPCWLEILLCLPNITGDTSQKSLA